MTIRNIVRKATRVLAILVISMLLLTCLLVIFINTPYGKTIVKNRIQSYLAARLKTKVVIGKVDYSLPQWIDLKNVYIEDQVKDTLLSGEEMRVDINMLKLLNGNTDIEKVYLKNIFLNIRRGEKDSVYNFQFFIDAFTGNKLHVDPDTAALKITLNRLVFENVGLRFKDESAKSSFSSHINHLDGTLRTFQPDRMRFYINDFVAKGIEFFMVSKELSDSGVIHKIDSVINPFLPDIRAGSFTLSDVKIAVRNVTTGLVYSNDIKRLHLTDGIFNMNSQRAGVDTILLDSSFLDLSLPSFVKRTSNNTPAISDLWKYEAKYIAFSENSINYDYQGSPKVPGLDVNHLTTTSLNATINDFSTNKEATKAVITNLSFKDGNEFQLDTAHAIIVISDTAFSGKELYVKTPGSLIRDNIELRYDSIAGIDLSPQKTSISAILTNTIISFNDLFAVFPWMKRSFPPSDFANNIIHLNTKLNGNLSRVLIPFLQINGLSGSSIVARGTLFNLTDINRFSYDLEVLNSKVYKSDFLKFVPTENRQVFADYPEVFNIAGHLSGDRNNLSGNINSSAEGLLLKGKLHLTNFSDPSTIKYDFDIQQAKMNSNFISGFLSKESLPQGFLLPTQIDASGKFKGTTNGFIADLKVNSSYGNFLLKGTMTNIKTPNTSTYDLIFSPVKFNIGKLLGQDSSLGLIAGTIIAKGKGLDFKSMKADITTKLDLFQFRNYSYRNIETKTSFDNGIIKSDGNIDDKHVILQYNLDANVKDKYPVFNAFLNVDTIQLAELGLYKDTLDLSFKSRWNAKNLHPHNLDFNVVIDSANVHTNRGSYFLDTISLTGNSFQGVDTIRLDSYFAKVKASGVFEYDEILPSLMQYIDGYYDIGDIPVKKTGNQQIEIEGSVLPHPLIKDLMNGLNDYSEIDFSGNYNSSLADSALNFKANIPYLNYSNNYIRGAHLSLASANERLNYTSDFDTLRFGSNKFYGTDIKGTASHDSLTIGFITQDNNKRDWFGLNAAIHAKGPVYTFRLNDHLLLNYEKWAVTPGNLIQYGPGIVLVTNFHISSDTASIRINSLQQVVNSPVEVVIDNFNLKSISSFFSRDTLFASGIMDARLTLSEFRKKLPAFAGDLRVTNLEILQQPVGNVSLKAERNTANEVNAILNITGNNNDITANGNYYISDPDKDFDLHTNIRKLNFTTLQGFTGGRLVNSSGNIHGNMDITGTFIKPVWNGELVFDTTNFTLAQLGTPYRINNQKIIFEYPKISFLDFSIRDSSGHEMNIKGDLFSKTLMNYDLDLSIKATDFMLINARKAINNQIYGRASVDADITIGGNSRTPDIEGNILIRDKSNLTIVLPESSFSKDESKRIIKFVDTDTFKIAAPLLFQPASSPSSDFAQFLNYNINIETTKASVLNIIIDPVTGDVLKVQGDATLNAGVDPGGHLLLAGVYELESGVYELNYQILHRKFNLLKGSNIYFAGDPSNARINITAEYIVNTSAGDLISSEVSGSTSAFNQKIPFRVILNLTGVLSHPEINFDIELPDENSPIGSDIRTTIENKLIQLRGDQSATNKQVFSLLLFNRFVGEKSSDFFNGNGGGNGFNDLAVQSVSQFISSALNQIASNLFKGIDIDLNLNTYSDYATGTGQQRTDLNVAVSKSLMNDRLAVSLGTNVGLQDSEDPTSKINGTKSGFNPDITLAYKLTKDGKYMIRAYRKNQFEVALDGYVVENGLSFIVTMDYDKFREIFGRKK